MIFDVSGSMNSQNRIRDLKSAAETAVAILLPTQKTTTVGDVRIAMTSYSHQVNLGDYFEAMTGETEKRTYPKEKSKKTKVCEKYHTNGRNRGKCKKDRTVTDWVADTGKVNNTCSYQRGGKYAFTDAAPNASDPETYVSAGSPVWFFDAPDWKKQNAERGQTDSSGGNNGYSEPRNTAHSDRYDYCPDSSIVPLTNDAGKLRSYIRSLKPSWGTSGNHGLATGWYLISPKWAAIWPSASRPLGYDEDDTMKVAVLMTDGASVNWMAEGPVPGWKMPDKKYADRKDDANDRMLAICDNMKAKDTGIQIYTIAFKAPGHAANILKRCATRTDMAFTASSAEELEDAYKTIAANISDLRIVR